MNIHTKIESWLQVRRTLNNKTIGFVHTMGNLHQGHLSLLKRAQEENDIVVAAIFVNPTQFNNSDDFNLYPRTIEQDITLLQQNGIDHLLLFTTESLYRDDDDIRVMEKKMSSLLEGPFRPNHFEGMLTIVLKFLNLVLPTHSYYGEKDYQQLLLIKKMCAALFLSTKIVGCKTIREKDGLACSSRNSRLNEVDRPKASYFPRLLMSSLQTDDIVAALLRLGFKVDYITEQWNRRLGAVWLSDVRLIDNVLLS